MGCSWSISPSLPPSCPFLFYIPLPIQLIIYEFANIRLFDLLGRFLLPATPSLLAAAFADLEQCLPFPRLPKLTRRLLKNNLSSTLPSSTPELVVDYEKKPISAWFGVLACIYSHDFPHHHTAPIMMYCDFLNSPTCWKTFEEKNWYFKSLHALNQTTLDSGNLGGQIFWSSCSFDFQCAPALLVFPGVQPDQALFEYSVQYHVIKQTEILQEFFSN